MLLNLFFNLLKGSIKCQCNGKRQKHGNGKSTWISSMNTGTTPKGRNPYTIKPWTSTQVWSSSWTSQKPIVTRNYVLHLTTFKKHCCVISSLHTKNIFILLISQIDEMFDANQSKKYCNSWKIISKRNQTKNSTLRRYRTDTSNISNLFLFDPSECQKTLWIDSVKDFTPK